MTTSFERISQNLLKIKSVVKPYNARVVAVTKYVDKGVIEDLYKMGQRDFGENKAVDAIKKINSLDEETKSNSTYHFIGHLQSNKVKKVVGVFDYIHSVDSKEIAVEISKVASAKGIVQKVLIQVNNANEIQKFGIVPSQLNNLLNEIKKLPAIDVIGLMNIAPLTSDRKKLHKLFNEMRKLKEEHNLKELSMGMSHDFEIALDEGATIIRLGSILYK